jgi:3-oxoacyl-[acyl-carrier-protein] synthase I
MIIQKTISDRIAITGIGLVTSLGADAPSSLAAIRSGLACFSEHETVMVHDNSDGTELAGAKIARVPDQIVSRHLVDANRAAALLAPAIRECLSGLPTELATLANWRLSNGTEIGSPELLAALNSLLNGLTNPALQMAGPIASDLGRCLFFDNIIHAPADLNDGICQMVLVGCVDSLCDSAVLEVLFEADRLKSATNPESIVAGEAAGVILLETESHARNRNAVVLAFFGAWGRGSEPHPWFGTTPSIGKGLTCAFHDAFEQLTGKGAEIDLVVADLNGERARAQEWALTAGRIFPTGDKSCDLMHPADCVGDCGAAMGAVLLATAAYFLATRRDLSQRYVAISTSDDDGARRVICLEKGDDLDIESAISSETRKRAAVLTNVIEQHFDDASFLWMIRNNPVQSDREALSGLARHDERLKANLDGLYLAGEAGWELAAKALRQGDASDFFVAAFLAFKSADQERITFLIDAGGTKDDSSKGVISALGWLPYNQAEPHIARFLSEPTPELHRIGLAASEIHQSLYPQLVH